MMDIEAQQEYFEECCRNHLSFLAERFGCVVQSKVYPVGLVYSNQFINIKLFTESYGSRLAVFLLERPPEIVTLYEVTALRNCSLDYVVPLGLPSNLLKASRKRNPTAWSTNAERYQKAAFELAVVHAGTCLRDCASDVLSGDFRVIDQLLERRSFHEQQTPAADLLLRPGLRQLRPIVDLVPM